MNEEKLPHWPWQDWVNRLSFRAKLSLMVNLLIILLIVGSALLVEHRQRMAIVQEVEKRAMVMAQALESATEADLLTYNYVSVEQSVAKFSATPDLVYAVVLDKEGNVAGQFVRDYPLRRIVGRGLEPRKAIGPTIEQVQVPGTERETVYNVTYPVNVEGSLEPWGTIRLGVSLTGMYREIARTRWQIAGFGVLALAL